jgi:signal peptidase I
MESLNLPLILFLLVFVSGLIWLFDILVLAKQRRAEAAKVDAQYSGAPPEAGKKRASYEAEREKALGEPAVVEYAKSFFPVLLLVFVLRSFIVEPFQIPSESMLPNLEVGDFIAVSKFSYGIRLPLVNAKVFDVGDPQRGDVMVFFPPDIDKYYIKRVIGLPGDRIRYVNNVLHINGERVPHEFVAARPSDPGYVLAREILGEESYLIRKSTYDGPRPVDGSWVVPEGHYFMMGDNRDNSADSRTWGVVPEENIVGKAFAIWMHWESLTSLPSFTRVGTID